MTELPAFEEECFFIAPIGADDSEERRRSNGMLDYVVAPAAARVGLEAIRADRIAKPGQITLQVVEHVLRAKGAVADLTGANPNVYYELAVRHTAKLPVVLIAEEGERLPFDIAQMRTIFLNHKDLASAARCMEEIAAQLAEALEGAVDSPITTSVNLQHLEQGNVAEKTLADLVTGMEGLTRDLGDVHALLYRVADTTETAGSRLPSQQREGIFAVQSRIWDLARRELRDDLTEEVRDYLIAIDRLAEGASAESILRDLDGRLGGRFASDVEEAAEEIEDDEPSAASQAGVGRTRSQSARNRSAARNRKR